MVTFPHQNVQLNQLLENQLKSLISQSVQSKSSTVETVVKLVLETKIIVKFVPLTELTHHIVVVSQDTSNLNLKICVMNVKLVDTDVSLVNLNTIVMNVLTAESTPQNVLAQPVCMMMALPSIVKYAQDTVTLAT